MNANERKYLCCVPAAHYTAMYVLLFAFIRVHLRFLFLLKLLILNYRLTLTTAPPEGLCLMLNSP